MVLMLDPTETRKIVVSVPFLDMITPLINNGPLSVVPANDMRKDKERTVNSTLVLDD